MWRVCSDVQSCIASLKSINTASVLRFDWVSPTWHKQDIHPKWLITWRKGRKEKRMGPRIDPWGTPYNRGAKKEMQLPRKSILWCQWKSYWNLAICRRCTVTTFSKYSLEKKGNVEMGLKWRRISCNAVFMSVVSKWKSVPISAKTSSWHHNN